MRVQSRLYIKYQCHEIISKCLSNDSFSQASVIPVSTCFFVVNQKLIWAAWFSESKTYGIRSTIAKLIYLLSRFFLVN